MAKIFESAKGIADDQMTVTSYSDNSVEFRIDAPWHGSSETGFGESLELGISREEAVRLRDALTAWIARTEQKVETTGV